MKVLLLFILYFVYVVNDLYHEFDLYQKCVRNKADLVHLHNVLKGLFMKISFYDVSSSQELTHLNGQKLDLKELYKQYQQYCTGRPKLALTEERFLAIDFHPYGFDQGQLEDWAAYFTVAVQLISGHKPSPSEIRTICEYIRRLPKDFKRTHVTKEFILCFVSYLFVSFKCNNSSAFIEDSNSIDALCEFTLSLCTTKKVLFSSFLCAHRDPYSEKPLNLLQSNIPSEKVRAATSLVLALAHNANEGISGHAIFLQQGPSRFASSSIFPEVTVTYLESGRGYEMIDRLVYQRDVVSGVLNGLHGESVTAKLVSLDVLTFRIERFLKARFGEDWRQKDYTSFVYSDDPIVELSIDMVLPSIQRMMPFFKAGFQQAFIARKEIILRKNYEAAYLAGGEHLARLVLQMIEWFMLQHSMTISAKAVYEATFYYLWGKYCGRFNGAFAVGFDRDHDKFQHYAWKLGASFEKNSQVTRQSVPLYLRRNPSGKKLGNLSDLSFRQFWRY